MGPQRDDKLRRCAALGWIIMENSDGDWKRTGHVMVVDMDDRDIRQRQPWLILAPEWPTDGVEMPDGTFTHRADEVARRDDSSVAGVFPGDRTGPPSAAFGLKTLLWICRVNRCFSILVPASNSILSVSGATVHLDHPITVLGSYE